MERSEGERVAGEKLHIVIPGGSGQVGQILARHFHAQDHRVTVLSRRPQAAPWQVIVWDAKTPGSWAEVLEASDVCINLTGRNVNCRYTVANRAEIYHSRIDATRVLSEAISRLRQPPKLWLNASTATIYRHVFDRPMDEIDGEFGGAEPDAPSAWRFSIHVAKDWEEAFFAVPIQGTRKIAMRSAVIFSPDRGSAFEILLNLVRFGLGGTNGSGKQWVSWVHEIDFVRAVEWMIANNSLAGPVNIAAPNPIPNREFMAAVRSAYGISFDLPATEAMIRLGCLLLRTEPELVLKSRRVVPRRLLDAGFQFEFPEWPRAATELVGRWKDHIG